MRLTLIGNGSMALSLAKGLSKNYDLEVIGRDKKKLQDFKTKVPDVNIGLLNDSFSIKNKNILLCIKPYVLGEVAQKLQGKANILFSILAGTSLQTLKDKINTNFIVRSMPNIGAIYNHSMTTLCGDKHIKNKAIDIFDKIGQTLWVDSQKELDIATAIGGSGPAFLAIIANGIIKGGIECGLNEKESMILTQGLFNSFKYLLDNKTPEVIIKEVMSPNGTTEKGYNCMQKNNIEILMAKTIKQAYNRAVELSIT